MKNTHDSEDILQDVLMQLIKTKPNFEDKELINLATWAEDNVSYLILSSNGIDDKDVLNMVKGIKIP